MGWRMEIGRFMRHPSQNARDGGFATKSRVIIAKASKLGIREAGMDRAVTNRMERDQRPPTSAFGDWMVPFGACAQRPGT